MERPAWAPQGIDISCPVSRRIYDYFLGGSHNFEVDREAARRAIEASRDSQDQPGEPRGHAPRGAIRGDEGITQFLDIGSRYSHLRQCPRGRPGRPPRRPGRLRRPRPGRRRAQPGGPGGQRGRDVAAADLRNPRAILENPETCGCSTWTGRWRCSSSPYCTSWRTTTTRTGRWPSCATRSRPAAWSSHPRLVRAAARCRPEQAGGAVASTGPSATR